MIQKPRVIGGDLAQRLALLVAHSAFHSADARVSNVRRPIWRPPPRSQRRATIRTWKLPGNAGGRPPAAGAGPKRAVGR